MGKRIALRFGAGALAIVFACASASADSRECPQAFDQTVVVRANAATRFRLDIRNDNNQPVTIFQYPELGQLLRDGTSQLDYIFTPTSTFGGTTYATYRVSQPNQCPGSVPIGRVTFVVEGPPATVVHSGDAVVTHESLCGSISIPVALPMIPAMWFAGRIGRRNRGPGLTV